MQQSVITLVTEIVHEMNDIEGIKTNKPKRIITMEDLTMNRVELDNLENVSGGFAQETNELKAFIKKHDPDYVVNSERDVLLWLHKKSGIKFSYPYATDENRLNIFRLSDGTTIYHETLMAMLKERFGE